MPGNPDQPSLFDAQKPRAVPTYHARRAHAVGTRRDDPATSKKAFKKQERSGRSGAKRQRIHRALLALGARGGTMFEVAADIGMADRVQNMSNVFSTLERAGLAYRTGATRPNPQTGQPCTVWWGLEKGQSPPPEAKIGSPLPYRELYKRALRCLEAKGIEFDPMEW